MRALTCLVFALTILSGWLSYTGSGSAAEFLKLAYAYLALMSVVCAMILLTMKRPRARVVPAKGVESNSV